MRHDAQDEAPGQPQSDRGDRSDAYDGPADPYDGPSSGYDGPGDGYDPAAAYDGARRYDGPTRDIPQSPRSSR
jgi:hypothetical protein